MDYSYYHHNHNYDYDYDDDDYNDYSHDGWGQGYGGDYDYDDEYWEDDYWYQEEESPEYYHNHYNEGQEYMHGGDRSYGASENHYGSQYDASYENNYHHGYSQGNNNYQSDHHQQQQYYGSNSWRDSESSHHSSSHVDHHHSSTRTITHTFPVPPTPPLLPIPPLSPPTPNIAVLPVLRTGTPLIPAGFPFESRAMGINRNQSLSVKPVDSEHTKSALTPTPTESFFHNLFWKTPGKPRDRARPTTPVIVPPAGSRSIPRSPNLTANISLNRSPSAAGNSPIAGYDAMRGRGIGFLAPSPERA
ncbi:hypothetical protein Z517_08953 [Fonsecaea pedrosoi CBS 271.37]|uniref:Unplaced genomic scaffold supercont1.5, whole genome shotgun sequence n=1 Tax=Fonsecaea pedrosoi CBS 271.37 TaxID=1442368 RepID=A0A0D2GEC8_9EURO|nr:uncharacterized protein Z517_08953 [Fonsecaea pedrosoi CBS 271.37]KIW79113.1 hypothetical protein Z517_08953 [Fonsecaea pedrosoi CBS 271.37]